MYEWRTRTILAAAFLMGCTGEIQAPGSGPGSNPNGSGSNGSGSNGSGANGSGANGTGATGTGATGTGATGTGGAGGGPGGDPTVCVPGVPGTSQLPRLTKVQYDNTIRDLVGLDSSPSTMLAPDTTGSVDQRAWDGYKAAADAVSQQIISTPAARSRAIPCTTQDAACAQQLVTSFGQRAFRRPLTDAEITRFTAMFTNRATLTATGTFDEAAQLMIRSFLLSPSFITRAEIAGTPEGDKIALSGWEVASRLSYMLWSSMPDDALFAAAQANELQTQAQILAQAQRMIQDPKARAMVNAFHQSYAHMGAGTRWDTIQRDPALYPSFSLAMIPMLSDETSRFFDQIVFGQGGTFKDLMTSPIAFVNSTLAPIYGLPAASYGAELTQVSLNPAQRPGLLTRAGFLTAYSLFNRPSAILRGAFIQKEVLCTVIGAPPADAEGTPLPTEGLLTNRERTDAQTAGDACAGCHHGLINPTGFAMEAFDAIGAWQTTEKDTGAAINTVSTVPMGDTEVDVTGPADLMNAIANSKAAQHCYAQRWVQFAYERMINPADSCTVDNLATKLTGTGYTVLNLVADLTQSDSFRLRVQEQ
jgi:hypothetical protein